MLVCSLSMQGEPRNMQGYLVYMLFLVHAYNIHLYSTMHAPSLYVT